MIKPSSPSSSLEMDFAEYGARLRVSLLRAEECVQICFLCCNFLHSLASFAGVSASRVSSVKVRLFGPLEKFESSTCSMSATVYALLHDNSFPFNAISVANMSSWFFQFICVCLRKKYSESFFGF